MTQKNTWISAGILFIVALALNSFYFLTRPPSFRGTAYHAPYPQAADFELPQANGATFRMSEQRGKIVLLYFGYTFCPDVCPTTLAELKQVFDGLDVHAQMAEVVFITLDPDRDTSQKMQEYANHFHPSFIGLSGSQSALEKIWNDYGAVRVIQKGTTPETYTVDHTARVTLVDYDGNMRLSYEYQTPVNNIIADIELLLKQRGN